MEAGSNFFSLLGILCAGMNLYLLNWSVYIWEKKLIFNYQYFIPYILTTILFLFSGNRQFLFIGSILITLNLIYLCKPKLKQTILWITITLMITIPLGISFQYLRQSHISGTQENFIMAIKRIKIIDDHPLKDIFTNNS